MTHITTQHIDRKKSMFKNDHKSLIQPFKEPRVSVQETAMVSFEDLPATPHKSICLETTTHIFSQTIVIWWCNI